MVTIWCLLCGEDFCHKTATRKTKSVIILCRRPAPECTCQNVLFHPPWTWHELSYWFMPHFFGQIQKEFWPIISLSLSGPMQWNIWYGHTNLLFQQMFGRASLPWNIYPGSALTIWISSTVMCGNVQSLSLKYTLTSNFPSGITSSIGSFCWTFWQTLLWRWLTSVICLWTSSHLNSMLFSMIYNCVCTGDDMSLSSRLLFSSMSINSMLKILSTKLVLLFISHPPLHDVLLKWSWTTTK